MVTYDSAAVYVDKCSTLEAKVIAIDAIIDALFLTALKAAAGENISQYSLNDGQVIISTTYKTAADVQKSINSFEQLRQMYINRINGRVIRLVDGKNLV